MALRIDDASGMMTSDAACVVALRCGGGCERGLSDGAWHVSGHQAKVLTRSEAMKAILLAELAAMSSPGFPRGWGPTGSQGHHDASS